MFPKLVLRSLWGRRGRTALVWIAMTIPAALVTGAANFLLDASSKLRSEVRKSGPNLILRPVGETLEARETEGIRARYPNHAERREGVDLVRFQKRETEAKIVSIDPSRAARIWTWWRVDGTWPEAQECLAGRRLADRLRVGVGDELSLGERGFRVSGILETEGEEERALIVRLADVGAERFSRIDFQLDADAAGVEKAAEEMRGEVPGAVAEPVRALTAAEGGVASRLRGVFLFLTLFILVLSGIGIAATLAASVQEQRREIGLATALGAAPALLVRLLAAQGALLLVASLLAGGVVGIGLSQFLGRHVFGVSTAIRPLSLAISLGSCAAMAGLAMVLPARRALAIEPSRVLREE